MSAEPPIPDSGFEQLPETNTFELKEDIKVVQEDVKVLQEDVTVLQEEPVEERTYENTQFISKSTQDVGIIQRIL